MTMSAVLNNSSEQPAYDQLLKGQVIHNKDEAEFGRGQPSLSIPSPAVGFGEFRRRLSALTPISESMPRLASTPPIAIANPIPSSGY